MQPTIGWVAFLIKYTTKPKECTTIVLSFFTNFVANLINHCYKHWSF